MKNDIATLRRETEQLRGQIGTATLQPVYKLIGKTGAETGIVDINGSPAEVTDDCVTFSILEAPFRLLSEGMKNAALPHGRGAGITNTLARYVLGLAIVEPCRILCAREIQLSLRESVWFLLVALIESDSKLSDFFTIQQDGIFGRNGSQFLFRGIRTHTAEALKSTENIKFCWVEEAQSISRRSLDVLVPTIRAEGARLFFSINQRKKTDPVFADYIAEERPDTAKPEKPYTIYENPLASQTLFDEAELMRVRDPERHLHVYMGGFETFSEARIFHNWLVQDIDIESVISQRIGAIAVGYKGTIAERKSRRSQKIERIRNSFGVGIDFGFTDPHVIILTYFDEDTGRLFILHEFCQTGLGPDGMLAALREFPMPSPKYPIYADHRPELISYLSRKGGYNVNPATKLQVAERIDRLKQLDIFISPNCPHAIGEFGLYSWVRDRQGVVIGDQPEDANNHVVDAVAYSLGKRLTTVSTGKYQKLDDPYL